jgi:hypothetical protein
MATLSAIESTQSFKAGVIIAFRWRFYKYIPFFAFPAGGGRLLGLEKQAPLVLSGAGRPTGSDRIRSAGVNEA